MQTYPISMRSLFAFEGLNENLKPDITGKLALGSGWWLTASSKASFRTEPRILRTIIVSGWGNIPYSVFVWIGPAGISWFSLNAPELTRAKSASQLVRTRSATKFPKFVSFVLEKQSLASKSTADQPMSMTSCLSTFF